MGEGEEVVQVQPWRILARAPVRGAVLGGGGEDGVQWIGGHDDSDMAERGGELLARVLGGSGWASRSREVLSGVFGEGECCDGFVSGLQCELGSDLQGLESQSGAGGGGAGGGRR